MSLYDNPHHTLSKLFKLSSSTGGNRRLGLDRVPRGIALAGLFDNLLELLGLVHLQQLEQGVEFGKLLLDGSGRGSRAFRLEVVGLGDDGGDGLPRD